VASKQSRQCKLLSLRLSTVCQCLVWPWVRAPGNACRCGRFRQSLGGCVWCCDEGAARVSGRRRRSGGSREQNSASQKTAGPRLVVGGYLAVAGGGCGAVVVLGRTAAVVSERSSSSEMAGQQLPSASDQGHTRCDRALKGATSPVVERIAFAVPPFCSTSRSQAVTRCTPKQVV
jgi:hypothetical protein